MRLEDKYDIVINVYDGGFVGLVGYLVYNIGDTEFGYAFSTDVNNIRYAPVNKLLDYSFITSVGNEDLLELRNRIIQLDRDKKLSDLLD